MRWLGVALWIVGGWLAGYAMLGFDPTVDSGPYGYGRIVNRDLQQQQLMMLITGCVLFLAGALLHAGSYLLAAKKSVTEKAAPSRAKIGSKRPATADKLAAAKKLGVTERDDGYTYGNQTFNSVDEAILVASQL